MTLCRYLVETGLLNAVLAGLLMLVAWLACRCFKSPAVGSLAWTIVLLKLLTPPCILLPIAIASWEAKAKVEFQHAPTSAAGNIADHFGDGASTSRSQFSPQSDSDQHPLPESNEPASRESTRVHSAGNDRNAVAAPDRISNRDRERLTRPVFHFQWSWSIAIVLVSTVWLGGSLGFAALAISRLVSFRSLVRLSDDASEQILQDVRLIAEITGLRSLPHVKVVDCRLPPSVGCWGWKPTLILPRAFYASLNNTERRSLIAHELAHLLRGDHWRAWLELAATVVFWWYPLAWLARRECRRATERCCDDRVLKWFPDHAHEYAETLLKSVDFVSSTGRGMPGIIHGIGDFTTMKNRIVRILKSNPSPSLSRPVKGGLGLIAIIALMAGIQFIRPKPGNISGEASAADGSLAQQIAVDTPRAQWKSGDVVFVIRPAEIRGEGNVITTLRRGTGLLIQQSTDDTLLVKEPDWGSGETAGSIERRSVATAAEAVEILNQQIEQDPNDAGAFAARANVRRHEREFDLALPDFNEAIRLDPHDAIFYLNRSRIWRTHEPDKEIADLAEAIRLDPQLRAAYKTRLGVYLIQEDFEKAGADCDQIMRLNPQDALGLTMGGMIAIAKNTSKGNDTNIAKLSKAIQRDPNDPQSYLKRAEAYRSFMFTPAPQQQFERPETDRERERSEIAIADYTTAIRLDSKLEKAWRGRGEIRLKRHEFDLAIADFTEAIAIDPGSVKAIYRRGLSWSEKKEFDKAIVDFTEVIRLDPKHSEAYKQRGHARERAQNDDRAIEDYTTAIGLPVSYVSFGFGFGARNEIKPQADIDSKRYTFLYSHRGALYAKRLDYEQASADYADSLRHNSKDHFTNRQLAWILATCPEAHYRNGEKAVEHAIIACQKNYWRDASDLDVLAAAYAEAGNFEKAIESQQRTCKLAIEADQSDYLLRLDLYKSGKPYRNQPTRIADGDKGGSIK